MQQRAAAGRETTVAAILNVWRHIKNLTRQSMRICLRTISPNVIPIRFEMKRHSLNRLFEQGRPNNNNNKMSSDKGSVPGQTTFED